MIDYMLVKKVVLYFALPFFSFEIKEITKKNTAINVLINLAMRLAVSIICCLNDCQVYLLVSIQ